MFFSNSRENKEIFLKMNSFFMKEEKLFAIKSEKRLLREQSLFMTGTGAGREKDS